MSRTHLTSNILLLWLSLSAAAAASLVSVGCSSSDDSGTKASAGKGGGGPSGGETAKAGSDSSGSEAGEAATGGVPDQPDDMGEGGSHTEVPSGGGRGGNGGTMPVVGGSSSTGGSPDTEDPGETAEGGAGGSADPGDSQVAAAQMRAIALVNGLSAPRKCTTCHDVTYRGAGFYPNITPDVETGIGSWDEEDIKVAIRDGKDKDGKTLCATMERYPFTDAELTDLAIYLKHLTPVSKKITSKCPSL